MKRGEKIPDHCSIIEYYFHYISCICAINNLQLEYKSSEASETSRTPPKSPHISDEIPEALRRQTKPPPILRVTLQLQHIRQCLLFSCCLTGPRILIDPFSLLLAHPSTPLWAIGLDGPLESAIRALRGIMPQPGTKTPSRRTKSKEKPKIISAWVPPGILFDTDN